MHSPERVQQLIARGVLIPCPASVEVDESIDPGCIAAGVTIHAGSRLSGTRTSIGPACEIGSETPATIDNCQLGHKVSLKGGFFSGATFLDGSNMGSGAHVRSGTLLEEEANGAHTVGFKQTILFPYVTAGSLINFCDCLMAGGSSRKHHSEIGSSYIHFNFTPHQDKATASLVGDVPRGVLLDQAPIFLGGQGGIIGPVRIAYGTVIPAGTICRRDILEENQLFTPSAASVREPQKYVQGMYRAINRIVVNNLIYIGNIWSLRAWYRHARRRFMEGDPFSFACWSGAFNQLDCVLEERLSRLGQLAGKMPGSLEKVRTVLGAGLPDNPFSQQRALAERWPRMEEKLKQGPAPEAGEQARDRFLAAWERMDSGVPYLRAVSMLDAEAKASATVWLQTIVDSAVALWEPV